jgi:membrane protein DedA with SNARE-associated domain
VKDWAVEYLGALGASGLMAGVVVEALGIPFPGGLMVILAGFLVKQGKLGFFPVLLATVAGFNVGAITAFFIGRYVGKPFLFRFSRYLRVTPERIQEAQGWLERSAPAFVIFGRFLPMVSNLTPYIAGISKLNGIKFFGYNFLFTILWAFLNLGLGIFFGHSWNYVLSVSRLALPLVAGGIMLILLYFIYLRGQKAKL